MIHSAQEHFRINIKKSQQMQLLWSFFEPDNSTIDFLKYSESKLESISQTFEASSFTSSTDEALSILLAKLQTCLVSDDENPYGKLFEFLMNESRVPFFILKMYTAKQQSHRQIAILQFLSTLAESLNRNFGLFLSKNFINTIISAEPKVGSAQGELLFPILANLIKTISSKVQKHQVPLLFNHNSIDYPIFTLALACEANQLDPMVLAAAKQTILNLIRMDDRHLTKSIFERNYISSVVGRLCFNFVSLATDPIQSPSSPPHWLWTCLEEKTGLANRIIDEIFYINDLFCLNQVVITESLSNSLMDVLILPVLLPNILEQTAKRSFQQNCSLFGLILICSEIAYSPLLGIIKDILLKSRTEFRDALLLCLNGTMDDKKTGLAVALFFTVLSRDLSTFSTSPLWENGAFEPSIGEALAKALLSLLSDSRAVRYSLFTKTVAFELLFQLLESGSNLAIKKTPDIQLLFKKLSEGTYACLEPFLTEEYAQDLLYLFEYETSKNSSSIYLRKCFLNPQILLPKGENDVLDNLTNLDIALKTRLLYDKLVGTDYSLINVDEDQSLETPIDLGSIPLLSCSVQLSTSGKAERAYLYIDKSHLHIIKPIPLLLGKGKVYQSFELATVAAEPSKQDLNGLNLLEKKIEFTQSRDGDAVNGVSGFMVVKRILHVPLASFIFPNAQQVQECFLIIAAGRAASLSKWLETFKANLNLQVAQV